MPKNLFEKGNKFAKGSVPWNKGKNTGIVPRSSFKAGNKTNVGKHWKIADTSKMNKTKIGKKRPPRSDEWKRNLGIARLGKTPWNYRAQTAQERSWQKNMWSRRKREADGNHSFAQWEELKAKYNWTCPACTKKEPEIKLTEDHIIPLVKGGSDNIENIQPLCLKCNLRKHTKTIKYKSL